ncbi:family 43 glycosylhydrolase [Pedobacter sp. SD-b]|uniref:Family 43 glycosylhydrolase n=1 Tax=Pedobacter segetis TaxID=2793069 RepID=A0ABS1BLH6_9SPHI|nr:family 43 glycosylhydrolase [Pedobacter segetis]MBK0383701.1 family 43 glycosylhydrolase [Pedobacter segetis]
MKSLLTIVAFVTGIFFEPYLVQAQNPIVPNVGLNDPHIHIFNDTAFVYASHDKSIHNTGFVMENWWIWSSPDLVTWTKRSILDPAQTYIGIPFTSCWATDVGYKNGKYYWYFSEKNQQTGVVVGNTPTGPWKDPLGKPLLKSDLTSTDEYDIAIFEDQGSHYIIFGVWDYYIAKLNDDMISLAEKPRKLLINNPHGPYNLDGKNKEMPTDDKPFVHKHNGKFYLSWGVFYAVADNIYGPYHYKGAIMNETSFAKGYDKPTWPNGFLQGRHGSFFEWHNQTYFAYCDISQTGNRWFRDTFISYLNYKDNGEMAVIRVDGVGVGQYDSNAPLIEAEDYFISSGIQKKENKNGGFVLGEINDGDYVIYANVKNLADKNEIIFNYVRAKKNITIEIRRNTPNGELLGVCDTIGLLETQTNVVAKLPFLGESESICLVFRGKGIDLLQLDSFSFH